jgi:hypothetical protein
MDLLSQLQVASKHVKPQKVKPANWVRATEQARLKHTADAVARYKAVMYGKDWMTQAQIEGALGYASTVSTDFLKKLWQELKLIERRNRDGAYKYCRKRGYEWRWCNGD